MSLREIRYALQGEDYLIFTASDSRSGMALLALNHIKVILAVQHPSRLNLLDFLHRAEEIYPHTVRLLLSDSHGELSKLHQIVNTGIVHKTLTNPIAGEHLRKHLGETFIYHAAISQDRA